LNFKFIPALIFILSFSNFALAGQIKGLIKENFGERYYGLYHDGYKLGYVIHKLTQNEDEIIQEFSLNMRFPSSDELVEEEGAEYSFSQIISLAQFDKETGLLKQMTEGWGIKLYADYQSLLQGKYFKKEISTRTARYKGDFSYEVRNSDNDENQYSLLKLPKLSLFDYFSEINFVHANPKVGSVRNIEVFDLDFETGLYSSLTLTLKEKIELDEETNGRINYVIKAELGDEVYTFQVDQYGNLLEGELLGFDVILEPKLRALAFDMEKI